MRIYCGKCGQQADVKRTGPTSHTASVPDAMMGCAVLRDRVAREGSVDMKDFECPYMAAAIDTAINSGRV